MEHFNIEKRQKLEQNILTNMKNLSEDFSEHGHWISVVNLANIYARGHFQIFYPNIQLSIKLYETVISHCPYIEISIIASLKRIEATTFIIDEDELKGKKFPTDQRIGYATFPTTRRTNTPAGGARAGCSLRGQVRLFRFVFLRYDTDNTNHTKTPTPVPQIIQPHVIVALPVNNFPVVDNQNVHDSYRCSNLQK